MKPDTKHTLLLLLFFTLLASYLVVNTGIFSDDFDMMARLKGKGFVDILSSKNAEILLFVGTPIVHVTHGIWYRLFSLDNQLAPNILKIFYTCLCLYFISQFFTIYVDRPMAYLISFLFIFFPSHDSTAYWFMVQYLPLSFALYLYAFYKAYNGRLGWAFSLALLGSFISHGSPPIALSLFLLFILYKQFKKGLVLLIPNIIYVIYYVYITKVVSLGVDKTSMPGSATAISLFSLMKNFLLQVLTFLDATLGPSMWLKIYYAFPQLSLTSLGLGILLTVLFYKKYTDTRKPYNGKLLISFAALTLLSFVMFATTKHYPQLAFNLGNRVTIFGSLLLAYVIVLLPVSQKFRTIIFALMIFTILGISDHWKDWSIREELVISNIQNNSDIAAYDDDKIIFVSGNQYSKYGPISHIEFFSEGWIVGPVFELLFDNHDLGNTLTKRHKYSDGYLTDMRGNSNMKIKGDTDYINVYDSERDVLFKIEVEQINGYIDSLPAENRHWLQLVQIPFIKNLVIRLMPRLKYVF